MNELPPFAFAFALGTLVWLVAGPLFWALPVPF